MPPDSNYIQIDNEQLTSSRIGPVLVVTSILLSLGIIANSWPHLFGDFHDRLQLLPSTMNMMTIPMIWRGRGWKKSKLEVRRNQRRLSVQQLSKSQFSQQVMNKGVRKPVKELAMFHGLGSRATFAPSRAVRRAETVDNLLISRGLRTHQVKQIKKREKFSGDHFNYTSVMGVLAVLDSLSMSQQQVAHMLSAYPLATLKEMLKDNNTGTAQRAETVESLLISRGLTGAQVLKIKKREQHRTGAQLETTSAQDVLAALDLLPLSQQQANRMLSKHPMATLKEMLIDFNNSHQQQLAVCSLYMKCSCWSQPREPMLDNASASVPSLLAIDCEFWPAIRFAAVDTDGRVRINCLIKKREPHVGKTGVQASSKRTQNFVNSSGLEMVELPRLQALLKRLAHEGTVFIAHTPMDDLSALEMPDLKIVDVATEHDHKREGLKAMAEKFLGLRVQQHYPHCPVEDALTAMRLYQHLSQLPNYSKSMSVLKR